MDMDTLDRSGGAPGDGGGGTAERLVARMRAGDREAAAEFLALYRPLIMRRFRCKICAELSRVWDLDDLFATVSRRLDRMVLEGKLTAATTAQLVDLVLTIGEHALADQQRRLPSAAEQAMAA